MARSKSDGPETMTQRINFLLQFGRGTMPITMLVKNEAEAEEARKMLKLKGKSAEAMITVQINDR